jgi:hypothetical protein
MSSVEPPIRGIVPAHPNALLPHARTRAARAAFGGERRRVARNAREHRRGGAALHTGAWTQGAKLSQAYAREYCKGDSVATGQLLPDTVLPTGLSAQERREACRALKGQILRQEVYAEDGTPRETHPYVPTPSPCSSQPIGVAALVRPIFPSPQRGATS